VAGTFPKSLEILIYTRRTIWRRGMVEGFGSRFQWKDEYGRIIWRCWREEVLAEASGSKWGKPRGTYHVE